MKQQIMLESKEVRKILAKALAIPESNVAQLRYSLAIENMKQEEVEERIKRFLNDIS